MRPLRPAATLAARAGLLAALGFGCASCSEEYLARRETLSPGSGDAVRANAAIQAIDPWPRHARRVDTDMSGERLQHVIENYRNPSTGPALPGAPTPTAANGIGTSALAPR